MFVASAPEEQRRQTGPRGSMTSQPHLIRKPRVLVRDLVSEGRKEIQVTAPDLPHLYMHNTHVHMIEDGGAGSSTLSFPSPPRNMTALRSL